MLLTEDGGETVLHQCLFHLGLISCNTFMSIFSPHRKRGTQHCKEFTVTHLVKYRTITGELEATRLGLSVTHALNCLLGLTYHLIPEQSQGVSNDNQLLSHSLAAKYMCSPGCSRLVLPQLCL